MRLISWEGFKLAVWLSIITAVVIILLGVL